MRQTLINTTSRLPQPACVEAKRQDLPTLQIARHQSHDTALHLRLNVYILLPCAASKLEQHGGHPCREGASADRGTRMSALTAGKL